MNTSTPLTLNILSKALLALTALAIFPGYSLAATEYTNDNATTDFSNWFKVEVVIYSRANNYTSETWPKNITLAYPAKIRPLIDPSATQEGATETTMSETPSGNAIDEIKNDGLAFTLLPANELSLTKERTQINREKGVKILFHNAWRQPVNSAENAMAVIIHGGDKFEDHYELEGYLTIALGRYLHAQTNLWLTQFEANYGQESYHWPPLPADPASLNANAAELKRDLLKGETQTDLNRWNTDFQLGKQNKDDPFQIKNIDIIDTDLGNISEKRYLIKQIATINHKRRMRSGELHYLDHPLAGILILITPYAPTTKD